MVADVCNTLEWCFSCGSPTKQNDLHDIRCLRVMGMWDVARERLVPISMGQQSAGAPYSSKRAHSNYYRSNCMGKDLERQ